MRSDRNLTLRYSLQQILYWAAVGGVVSFAATYLPGKGFSAAGVGLILFGAYVLSFLLQPLLAERADRAVRNVLPGIILALSCLSALCFLAVRFIPLPLPLFAAVYLLGVLFLDMQVPFINSVSMYYSSRGWKINYGLGRGMGGFGYALATLGYGYLIEYFGGDAMPVAAVAFVIAAGLTGYFYPKDDSSVISSGSDYTHAVSVTGFIKKYKWYCASLFGILFLGMFHCMVENYLIEIFRQFGGDSSNVGTALFIATITELPAMAVFPLVHKKIGTKTVLYTSGACFCLKGILFLLSRSVTAVYLAQLLQAFTYVLLSMVQMYYAGESTDSADMIKGQSFITASYTLGCAVGNLLGGVIISAAGVRAMLFSALGASVLGLTVLLITLPRSLPDAHLDHKTG